MPGLIADTVPDLRLRALNDRPVRESGEYVLYWMIAARRTTWNFGLQRAVEWARRLDRPLVVLEPLRCDYRWASDRLHRFVLDGMAENARRLTPAAATRRPRSRAAGSRDDGSREPASHAAPAAVTYLPYVEPAVGAGRGLLAALGAHACVVVTDDFPCFFLPAMTAAAARALDVRLETVDGNGLLPLRAANAAAPTAYAFRRVLQRLLPAHLHALPQPEPLAGVTLPALADLPREIRTRWPTASLPDSAAALAALPIDHAVSVVATRGGSAEAGAAVQRFLTERLSRYAEERSEPDSDASSGLSPWLHFGHVSPHAVFAALARHEDWTPARLGSRTDGRKEGFWGLSAAAESFLDELVTWRELGFNMAWQQADHDRYESLPGWARVTLEKHATDPREHLYSLEQFAAAATHDALWNAAQRQLLREGRMHNYLRMLWGKKVLEWTETPQQAAQFLIELNNRYALDGRDPNSFSGIYWCLGRYDRPWAPERPVFGTIRWMSSANTARKLAVKGYLQRYGP